MGLLSDPVKRKKIVTVIANYNNKLCVLCYVAGVIWFLALAYLPLNAGTYFSENALLPGLVDHEFYSEINTQVYLDEMKAELKKDKRKVPRDWIIENFRSLGLDTYIQNYSIKYPLNIARGQSVPGQNVYAILRARRAASTEAIVLSAPLRPLESDLPQTTGGIVLMMALAKFFRKQTYLSKDIIFLVTDHEQIGLQGWLDGYHDIPAEYIQPTDVMGRSGSIQAAINLEIPDGSIRYLDVKIEGMNGQLPNLDLFNMVVRLCQKERVDVTLHRQHDPMNPESIEGYQQNLKTMMKMMWAHAASTPTGNHGLFLKYHIEAVTLQGIRRKKSTYTISLERTGRIVEGVFRSLNNLLERFHQSFFFYVLPSTSRYVSIGLYMPPFGLICAAALIKAVAIWIAISSKSDNETPEKENTESQEEVKDKEKVEGEADDEENDAEDEINEGDDIDEDKDETPSGLVSILPVILVSSMMGVLAYTGPDIITMAAPPFRIKLEDTIAFGLLALYTASLLVPKLISRKQQGTNKQLIFDWELLKSVTLIFMSLVLFSIALINISLAFFLAVAMVPITVITQPSHNRIFSWMQKAILLLVSPGVLLFIASVITSAGEKYKDYVDLLDKSWIGLKHGLFLSIIDQYLFGSWMFGLFTFLLLPIWLMFWNIAHCSIVKN